MRQQRHFRLDPEATHRFRRHDRNLRQLFRRRIVVHVRVGDKRVAARQQQRVHRARGFYAVAIAENLLNHAEMLMIIADRAANHRVGFAAMHHDGANYRTVANHRALRLLLRDATALHDAVILVPVLLKARVRLVIHDFEIFARLDLQTEFFQAHLDNARTPHQHRLRQAKRNQLLGRMQHARLFAFGQHHALRIFARLVEDRLHEQVGFVDKFGELVSVRVEILNRAGRHAGIHRRFRHRRRDSHDKARVERFRNDVIRAERQLLIFIGRGHHFALLGVRQFSDGMHRRELHLFVDGGRAHIQRATEDEREAEDIVHLVREI